MSRTFARGRSMRSPRFVRRVRQPWRWLPFVVRLRFAKWRSMLLQRRIAVRVLRLVAVVGVFALLAGASARSRAVQQEWGTTLSVVVMASNALVGESTDEVDWRVETRPAAFVPADALRSLPERADVLVRALHAGDIATERDLRSTTPALAIREGRRAMSVPLDASVPRLHVGDVVELFVVEDVLASSQDRSLGSVESTAIVLDVHDDAATLSVLADHVQALANAALNGRVVIALR